MNPSFASYEPNQVLIAPSLLAADFAILRDEVARIENASAEVLHLDIMDGHFVPNLTFGPGVVKALRPHSNMIFDTHLMLEHPLDYIAPFTKAGSDHITFHIECADAPEAVLDALRSAQCTVGLSVKPKTPIETIFPYLDALDMVLIMSVEPGFGGQSFMPEVLDKTRVLAQEIQRRNRRIHIEMDGGITPETAPLAKAAGVNVLVAGTAVFRAPQGAQHAIAAIRA